MSAAADAPRSWEARLGLRPWLTPEEIERLTPEELAALRAEAARILAQLPPAQVSTPRGDIGGELAIGLLDGEEEPAPANPNGEDRQWLEQFRRASQAGPVGSEPWARAMNREHAPEIPVPPGEASDAPTELSPAERDEMWAAVTQIVAALPPPKLSVPRRELDALSAMGMLDGDFPALTDEDIRRLLEEKLLR